MTCQNTPASLWVTDECVYMSERVTQASRKMRGILRRRVLGGLWSNRFSCNLCCFCIFCFVLLLKEEVFCLLSRQINIGGHEWNYIASQGPLSNTCQDFWQMVWEQGVAIIAMVTAEEVRVV